MLKWGCGPRFPNELRHSDGGRRKAQFLMLASVPSTGVDGDKERMGGREALSCHEITPPPQSTEFRGEEVGDCPSPHSRSNWNGLVTFIDCKLHPLLLPRKPSWAFCTFLMSDIPLSALEGLLAGLRRGRGGVSIHGDVGETCTSFALHNRDTSLLSKQEWSPLRLAKASLLFRMCSRCLGE